MLKRACGLLVVSVVLSESVTARRLLPQSIEHASQCRALQWPSLEATAPGYAEAHVVAARLSAIGVSIGCVAPSKWANWFDGQQGAALYRTSAGEFDILFLPAEQTFAALRVTQHQGGDRYLYSFEGSSPRPRVGVIESARRIYFSAHANRLLVTRDAEVVLRIANALEDP